VSRDSPAVSDGLDDDDDDAGNGGKVFLLCTWARGKGEDI
jgi:hypothetical protein